MTHIRQKRQNKQFRINEMNTKLEASEKKERGSHHEKCRAAKDVSKKVLLL